MNDKLLRTFDKVESNHWWWAGRRHLLKILSGEDKPVKILDVGCGTGQTLIFLKSLFPKSELFGIDPTPLAIKFAKKHGLKHVRKGRAEKLPYKDAAFDLVLMLDVIEHIKDDYQAVKEAKRVLRRGGKLIVTTPALSFIWSNHDKNQGHYRRYTRHRLRDLAVANRLKINFVSYFNFFLSPIIIPIRLLGNLKIFSGLNNYDSKLNYSVAEKTLVNTLLKELFIFEISLLRWIRYPIGISIAGEFVKR